MNLITNMDCLLAAGVVYQMVSYSLPRFSSNGDSVLDLSYHAFRKGTQTWDLFVYCPVLSHSVPFWPSPQGRYAGLALRVGKLVWVTGGHKGHPYDG